MNSPMRSLGRAVPVGVAVAFLGGALLASTATAQVAPAAPAAPAARGVGAQTSAWTTFKGDRQRTGASDAKVSLPLALQWRYSSTGPARTYTTTPLVIGAPGRQRVIFASGQNVYALDAQTGAQLWKSPDLPSSVIVPLTLLPTSRGDLILALQSGGRLVALQSADGGRVWETDTGAQATEAGPILAETTGGTRIICALNTGLVVALDETGALDPNWRVQLGNFGVSTASSMSLSSDGSRLFLLGNDAKLYYIDALAGRVLYAVLQDSRSGVTPVVNGDTVLTANARRVAAWSVENGAPKWTLAPPGDVVGSPALMRDAAGAGANTRGNAGTNADAGLLFFGTRNGKFQAVNAADGTVKWQVDLGDTVKLTGSPLALRDVVMVGTSDGVLLGFRPADGTIVWQYRLQTERVANLRPRAPRFQNTAEGGPGFGAGGAPDGGGETRTQTVRTYGISSAPAAIDNTVFVWGDNAALYAFTAKPFDADPPRVVEPSIAVNATDRQLLSLLVTPENPQIVPGVGPFYFATQIDDVGSGVDPTSIKISIDDVPVDPTRVFYGVATSVLTVTLVDPAKNDPALTDGLKKVTVTARDYAGNSVSFVTNFLVDNTAAAPAVPGAGTAAPGGAPGGNGPGMNGGNPFGGP